MWKVRPWKAVLAVLDQGFPMAAGSPGEAAIKDDRKTFLNSQGREPVLVLVDREVYGLPRSGDAAISDDCM